MRYPSNIPPSAMRLVPTVVEQTHRGERGWDIYSRLLKDRIILLGSEIDDDVANVELDYVTKRFRDFSPGEFVWRDSGVLRDLGIGRVVTSPAMINPYYERVGFRREGASYVLAV